MQYPHTLIALPAHAAVAYPGPCCRSEWAPVVPRLAAVGSILTLDAQFIAMLGSFRGCGGLARAEEALA